MYVNTAHPPPATGVETSSASVQLPDPNINFSHAHPNYQLRVRLFMGIHLLQAHWIHLLVHLLAPKFLTDI